MNQAEIVIHKADETSDFQLEVRVEDETAWLTQTQFAELFNATKQNISLHISNIFRERELEIRSEVLVNGKNIFDSISAWQQNIGYITLNA